jgi:Isochorismatase family
MTRVPIRDPLADHLITPQNAALMVVDYQQNQFRSVRSMDSDLLLENVVSTAKLAKLFGLPIVRSTVGVAAGQDQSTLPELADLLEDDPPIDQTTINSWEDAGLLAAVRATRRRKLILCDPLDRDVYGVHGARCDARGVRGVPRCRRNQLGIARGRATARLGAGRDRSRNCRDRLHRAPVDGMSGQSVLMERSRTDHTRDPLCPVCSRPIKNNATAIQLSGLRLQP